ncbi:LppX_LprAFG lipoprotein [Streptomyces canus]|uniref:LppX_LprAFG lipoprotein n=1 Tax=Streptomyces canus TaxID=58343 RepID=UPI0027D8DBEA|nr:LppX_LprAFG lipoprotein [Streptomyces canus]
MSSRVRIAAFTALVLAGGSVACGGSATSDPAAAVAKAAENSENITSLRYRISGTLAGKGRLEAEASMTTKPSAMSLKMNQTEDRGGDGRLEVRFVDGVMYVGGSALRSEKLNGKSWLSAAPAVWGRGNTENQSYGVLPRQLEQNLLVQSTLLVGSKDLRVIGTETVDGTRATHYKGTVDVDSLRGERLDQIFGLEASDPLTMDLWVDGDDRPKQFRFRARHLDLMTNTEDGRLELTVTFLDIDQPVTIKAPRAEDTRPLGDDTADG